MVVPVVVLGPRRFEQRLRVASPAELRVLEGKLSKRANAGGRHAKIWAALARAVAGVLAGNIDEIAKALRSAARLSGRMVHQW